MTLFDFFRFSQRKLQHHALCHEHQLRLGMRWYAILQLLLCDLHPIAKLPFNFDFACLLRCKSKLVPCFCADWNNPSLVTGFAVQDTEGLHSSKHQIRFSNPHAAPATPRCASTIPSNTQQTVAAAELAPRERAEALLRAMQHTRVEWAVDKQKFKQSKISMRLSSQLQLYRIFFNPTSSAYLGIR